MLGRFGEGEARGERSSTGGGDLDLDPDRLLLLEIDRARSPRDLGLPAGGERLRTGLLLYPPPLPRSRYTGGLREMLRLLLLYLGDVLPLGGLLYRFGGDR